LQDAIFGAALAQPGANRRGRGGQEAAQQAAVEVAAAEEEEDLLAVQAVEAASDGGELSWRERAQLLRAARQNTDNE
jgi:hypothetical protein